MKTLYYMCLNYWLSFVTFALAQLSVQVLVNSFWHREVHWVPFSWYEDIICSFSKPYSQNLKTLFLYLIIYLFICLFICLFVLYLLIFLALLFSLLFSTFILLIYPFLYLPSQSILHYLLCILFVISLCS